MSLYSPQLWCAREINKDNTTCNVLHGSRKNKSSMHCMIYRHHLLINLWITTLITMFITSVLSTLPTITAQPTGYQQAY